MRLPNISSSNSIIQKIKDLDQQRFKLDAQITSGQKLTLPEDDGMRLGRVIQLETQKGQLTQYQRNASYAKEYLDAGHLNLDKLRELNQRGQEIARTAGSSLNGPAMETYGFELNQLIEEALNRVNSTHRKQALFGGTKLKPEFGNSEILLGKREQKTFTFNEVGSLGNDGKRRVNKDEVISFSLNGREYVVQSKIDGLSTDSISTRLKDLINNDAELLSDSLSFETSEYKAFVRGSSSNDIYRNPKASLNAEIATNGDLLIFGSVGESYQASSSYTTKWDPNYYFPEQLEEKLNAETALRYPGTKYTELSQSDKQIVDSAVQGSDWNRNLSVTSTLVKGTSTISVEHTEHWKRLTIYKQGDIVEHDGRFFESIGSDNVNHSPVNSGTDYWTEVGSGYKVPREDWDLEVTGTTSRFYYTTPDGKLFADQATATSYAQNILLGSKINEYQQSSNPGSALATDLANMVRRIAVPVNEFSVNGSDSEAAVFFDPETLEYKLVAAGDGGSVVKGTFIKENGQVFSSKENFQNNDVILHEGRYFLVQDSTKVDPTNLEHIVEHFPPPGDIVTYSGQNITLSTLPPGQNLSVNAGQYIHDDINNKYYLANQSLSLSPADINSVLSQATATASTMPRDPATLDAFNSSPFLAGNFISPNGTTALVASDVMRGTFDPKKDYAIGDVIWDGVDASGDGIYYELQSIHLGEWKTGEAVSQGQTTFRDGKLYEASNQLTSASNTDSNFASNWQELGTPPNPPSASQFSNMSVGSNPNNVSPTVKSEATDVTNTINNKYFKEVSATTNPVSVYLPGGLIEMGYAPDDVQLKKGQYFHDTINNQYLLVKSDASLSFSDTTIQSSDISASSLDLVSLTERSDGSVFLLGDTLPTEGKEHIYSASKRLDAKAGDYIYDPDNNDFYVAKQNFNKPADWVTGLPVTSSDLASVNGKLYFANSSITAENNTLANFGTNWSEATTWLEGFAVSTGDYAYRNGDYYVANADISPVNNTVNNFATNWKLQTIPDYSLQNNALFSKVGSSDTISGPRSAEQGDDWSPNLSYDYGQIVYHEGKYFQCQRNSFNNYLNIPSLSGDLPLVTPSDINVPTISGQLVANDIWLQVEKPLDHVFKFKVENTDSPTVTVQPAGSSGIDAQAEAIVDSDGQVVGLKVIEPGRYFFGSSSGGEVPPNFQKAKVMLSNGQEMEADILWGQNPSDPGPYKILGFDISGDIPLKGTTMSASIGDNFTFATGTKTFLDHRDSNGDVINITYTGSNKNSQYYIGNESKISGFLDADNKGTEELGDVVNSLVDLRDALSNATPSHYSQAVEDEEMELLNQEDKLINKLGELSARMVRMETVRAHDEDYFVQLDQRISNDVDIDLSEAIMRLTRLSTSYQAALQIGSQLLNTSLLNYL
jgi:flagellin-like hook-associated protein FlgL